MEFNDIPKKRKKPINPHPAIRGRHITDVDTGRQRLQQKLDLGARSVGGGIGSGNKIEKTSRNLASIEDKLGGNSGSEKHASAVGIYTHNKDIAVNKLKQKLNKATHSVLGHATKHTDNDSPTTQKMSVASRNAQKSNPPPIAPTAPIAPRPAVPPTAPVAPKPPTPPSGNVFRTPRVKKIKPFSNYYKPPK